VCVCVYGTCACVSMAISLSVFRENVLRVFSMVVVETHCNTLQHTATHRNTLQQYCNNTVLRVFSIVVHRNACMSIDA